MAGDPVIDEIVGLKGSAAKQFFCRFGNLQSEVFEYSAPMQGPLNPSRGVNEYGDTHIAMQVEGVAAVHARIVAAGLTAHTPPDLSAITIDEHGNKRGYTGTYCRDFFGHVFEILEIHQSDTMRADLQLGKSASARAIRGFALGGTRRLSRRDGRHRRAAHESAARAFPGRAG